MSTERETSPVGVPANEVAVTVTLAVPPKEMVGAETARLVVVATVVEVAMKLEKFFVLPAVVPSMRCGEYEVKIFSTLLEAM